MVVKCEADERHPIGYLHTTFVNDQGNKFRCDCDEDDQRPLYLSNSTSAKRCIHFYSCLAVFLSDPKLAREFDAFVKDDQIVAGMVISIITTTTAMAGKSRT